MSPDALPGRCRAAEGPAGPGPRSCRRPVDLAVVGNGPTGLAAAVRAAAEGLSVTVFGRSAAGGGVRSLARIDVVPGHPVGITGAEYAARTVARAERYGVQLAEPCAVEGLETWGGEVGVRLAGGRVVRARALLAATGAERTLPAVPGAEPFLGAGVYARVPESLPPTLRGRAVFVVGEPEAAARLALRLAGRCGPVVLVGDAARAPGGGGPELAAALRAPPDLVARPGWRVAGLLGVDDLETVVLECPRTGRTTVREAAALFLAAEGRPRSSWLAGACATRADGAIVTGVDASSAWPLTRPPLPNETSLPGVFAAGEVRRGGGEGWEAVADGMAAVGQVLGYLRSPWLRATAPAPPPPGPPGAQAPSPARRRW